MRVEPTFASACNSPIVPHALEIYEAIADEIPHLRHHHTLTYRLLDPQHLRLNRLLPTTPNLLIFLLPLRFSLSRDREEQYNRLHGLRHESQ